MAPPDWLKHRKTILQVTKRIFCSRHYFPFLHISLCVVLHSFTFTANACYLLNKKFEREHKETREQKVKPRARREKETKKDCCFFRPVVTATVLFSLIFRLLCLNHSQKSLKRKTMPCSLHLIGLLCKCNHFNSNKLKQISRQIGQIFNFSIRGIFILSNSKEAETSNFF